MHSHIIFSAAAKGGIVNMNRKTLSAQAAALAAELAMKFLRVNTLRGGIFDEIADAVGGKRLRSNAMHETGLMKQIVYLVHA